MQHRVVSIDPSTLLVVAGDSLVGRPLSHWVHDADRDDLARILVVAARTSERRRVRASIRQEGGAWALADLEIVSRAASSDLVLVQVTITWLKESASNRAQKLIA